jgi:predicted transcriptional regulator of viral defense system
MGTTLGQLETRLLAYAHMRGLRTVRTGTLGNPLRITATQERYLLSRMAGAGLLARVRRGLYLVPPRLPLGGTWSPDEVLALETLVGDRKGAYQICGPNAFNHYGFDEQISARVYAYNDRLSGDRTIGSVSLTLIKVASDRLGATEVVVTPDGRRAVYSSRARSLVDAVYDWSRFGSLPRAYGWIDRELQAGRVSAGELVQLTLRYGNRGTIRRIGTLLDRLGVSAMLLKKLERGLEGAGGVIPFVPDRPRRGRIAKRWGVIVNE